MHNRKIYGIFKKKSKIDRDLAQISKIIQATVVNQIQPNEANKPNEANQKKAPRFAITFLDKLHSSPESLIDSFLTSNQLVNIMTNVHTSILSIGISAKSDFLGNYVDVKRIENILSTLGDPVDEHVSIYISQSWYQQSKEKTNSRIK